MKHLLLHRILLVILLTSSLITDTLAEGSKDFIDLPGERLFFHAQVPQQLKVYVAEGEYLNFGASHVGITGGYITVYRPDVTVHSVYDNTGATEGLVDRALYKTIGPGVDTIFWNAENGLGTTIDSQVDPMALEFKLIAVLGEIHIALPDIEENPGGIIFRRLNGMNT